MKHRSENAACDIFSVFRDGWSVNAHLVNLIRSFWVFSSARLSSLRPPTKRSWAQPRLRAVPIIEKRTLSPPCFSSFNFQSTRSQGATLALEPSGPPRLRRPDCTLSRARWLTFRNRNLLVLNSAELMISFLVLFLQEPEPFFLASLLTNPLQSLETNFASESKLVMFHFMPNLAVCCPCCLCVIWSVVRWLPPQIVGVSSYCGFLWGCHQILSGIRPSHPTWPNCLDVPWPEFQTSSSSSSSSS